MVGEFQESFKGGGTGSFINYDDIYVFNINPRGDFEWVKMIPKAQRSATEDAILLGFFLTSHEDELYFVFNDNIKNEGIMDASRIQKYLQASKGSGLMVVKMNQNGDYSRKLLVGPKTSNKLFMHPKSCYKLSDNEFIVFGLSNKKNGILRVTIN